MVNRFQNALTPATLIAGFSFTALADLDFTENHKLEPLARSAEPAFYICSTVALLLALYVTAVATVGIVFGQRLTIQATAEQGYEHDATVRELNSKFVAVLVALGCSMLAVAGAAISVVLLKDPSHAHDHSYVSKVVGGTTVFLFLCTMASVFQMFWRLHTPTPQNSKLTLRAGKGKSYADVPEFYLGSDPPPGTSAKRSSSSDIEGGVPPGVHYRQRLDAEQQRPLLPCLEREGKRAV